jgi:hypothetical protein
LTAALVVKAMVSKILQICRFLRDLLMASHRIGKFLPSFKLKLGTKAVISAVLLIAVPHSWSVRPIGR